MKMISRTSTTSTNGVTFISGRTSRVRLRRALLIDVPSWTAQLIVSLRSAHTEHETCDESEKGPGDAWIRSALIVGGIAPAVGEELRLRRGMPTTCFADRHVARGVLPRSDHEPRCRSEKTAEKKTHRQMNTCLQRVRTLAADRSHRLIRRKAILPNARYGPPVRRLRS